MTTAPTPSEQVWQLSCALEIAAALPDMPQVTIPRIDALEAAAALQRLERENDRLRTERHVALCKVEALEPELTRVQADNERLRGKVGRFQGVPLPLIEAINAATGGNDWQGEHSPAELLDPACRAIAELEARKPLPLSDDDRLRLRSDVARAIWDVMREHEDRCDHALEDVEPKHQVWDCADAAIKAVHGVTGGSS